MDPEERQIRGLDYRRFIDKHSSTEWALNSHEPDESLIHTWACLLPHVGRSCAELGCGTGILADFILQNKPGIRYCWVERRPERHRLITQKGRFICADYFSLERGFFTDHETVILFIEKRLRDIGKLIRLFRRWKEESPPGSRIILFCYEIDMSRKPVRDLIGLAAHDCRLIETHERFLVFHKTI
jgi:hypothetical protein